MKNLIISCVGEKSLHKEWISNSNSYDIFLLNYCKKDYSKDCKYYIPNQNGSKYNIIYENKFFIFKILDNYKNIFLPDDDIYINPKQIENLFNIHDQYKIFLSMPSLRGLFNKYDERYIEKKIVNSDPELILKFTNWVGIICPCFSIDLFKDCIETFNYNKSNWGIAFLWTKFIKENKKIAIIDNVEAIHTRRLYIGDNYKNNLKHRNCQKELENLIHKNKLKQEYKIIEKVFIDQKK